MTSLSSLYNCTLGKKYIMALTGVGLFLFVLARMIGNLQVFLGPDVLNAYALFLKSKPTLLWAMRSALLVIVFFHILAAVQLTLRNRVARPEKYHSGKP